MVYSGRSTDFVRDRCADRCAAEVQKMRSDADECMLCTLNRRAKRKNEESLKKKNHINVN